MTASTSNHQSGDELSFLVFSDDWGVHPSSCQHLFQHISKKHKVLWVNTIGMRNPKLNSLDFQKAATKISKMLRAPNNASNNLSMTNGLVACQPAMLPFSKLPGIRQFNALSVVHHVRHQLAKLRMHHPLLVTTVPNACDYLGRCGESIVAYYCVDDFAEWPGLDSALIRGMEQVLVRKSDILIATSESLYKKLLKSGRQTHLLTHGVDRAIFEQANSDEHHLLSKIPKPRVGYFGLFDERSNYQLLADVASRMPHIAFVITGRVEMTIPSHPKTPNIYFTGSVPYAELPAVVKGLDILFLPYRLNKLTKSISPLKLKEYLATGKPIVSTPLPEVLNFQQYFYLASTAAEWQKCINTCLRKTDMQMSRPPAEFWEFESWEYKADIFANLCRR